MDFAQARYYGGSIGRFTSVDPENAGASPNDPQSWNGYAYVRNSPLLYSDPDGLEFCIRRGGDCETVSDEQFNLIKNNPNNAELGVVVKDNKIFNRNENGDLVVVATYQRTGFDDFNERANRVFFGTSDTAGLTQRLEPVKKAVTAGAMIAGAQVALPMVGLAGGGLTTLGLSGGAETAVGVGEFAIIGQLPATANFIGLRGANVLNISPWTPALNNAWIQKIIANRIPVLAVSLADKIKRDGVLTSFGKEVQQLQGAGYRWFGQWLVPPP